MTESGQRREVPPEPVRHDALRVAAELTGQVLWSLTPEGELSEDSPSWRAFTGQTLEEARGRGWWDAIHSEDREAAEHAWREARSRAGPCEIDYRVRRPNLRYTRVRMRGLPVLGSEGGPRAWIATSREVWADESVRRSEERLRLATPARRVDRMTMRSISG